MPVRETANTVTVGSVCLSCALYAAHECPYNNHKRQNVSMFQGDIRGKCTYYMPIAEASGKTKMTKKAIIERDNEIVKESKINVELFKKIYALSNKDREILLTALTGKDRSKMFDYYKRVYPPDYAEDLVSDENESEQKGIIYFEDPAITKMKKKKRKNK